MTKLSINNCKDTYGWDYSKINDFICSFKLIHDVSKDDKVWLAGGALRRAITKEVDGGDFDLFFNKTHLPDLYRNHFISKGYDCVAENEFNISLKKNNTKVQLIKFQFYPNVEQLLNSFDFTLCQLAWDMVSDDLYVGDLTLFDISNKKIIINKITYPTASLSRLIKYTNQKFYACRGVLSKFLNTVRAETNLDIDKVRYLD